MHLTAVHVVFVVLTTCLVLGVGIYAGTRVKSAADFATGSGKAGIPLVAGAIMGTIVGGSSTVGTAQLAFQYGVAAWWFTLGAGISCLMLGLFLAGPMRESGRETIPQFLSATYGPLASPITTVFSSIGIFLSIVAQVIAAVALLGSMFRLAPILGAAIAVILIICYVFFGGLSGAGMVGLVKFALLYSMLIVTGLLAYSKIGGLAALKSAFPAFPYFSLFGRGFSIDLASGLALLVGIISTQTYFQTMIAAKDTATAKKGALIAAILIPPTGLAGILVGFYMKMNFPQMNSAEALPVFVMSYLPPWLGGIVLGTLLITVIGTAAGLTLGISTMLTKDIYQKYIAPQASGKNALAVSKILIILVAVSTLLFVTGNLKTLILQWSFLSMGLRGASACIPLLAAVYFPAFVHPKAGLIALVAGPTADIIWKLVFPAGLDPLYAGLAASAICLAAGSLIFNKRRLSKRG